MAGISLAPADYTFAPSPTWERIDQAYNVTGWTVDRGRQTEMGRADTGAATIELVDKTGDFDPTNPSGHFYGRLPGYTGDPMGPLVQAKIELQHPVTSAWSTLFRGYISQIQWAPYQTERFANVTLHLVDALALLAAYEMPSDFGDDFLDGNIVFYEDDTLDAVRTRVNKVLDGVGWDPGMRTIFSGNVGLFRGVYAPRSTVLQVLFDACDAEWPDTAVVYVGGPKNPGKIVFHGRFARFHPEDVSYSIQTFQAGDDTAAQANSSVVRVSPPLVASLDDTSLYTSALATPQHIVDPDIPGQYVQAAPPAVATKGLRTWSAENLQTAGGSGPTTAKDETKKFASYVAANYFKGRVRVGQLTVKARHLSSLNAAATWTMLTNVDISDIVHLKTSHYGGGGFDTDFYVEGLHYQARPAGAGTYVELTLDVSPKAYYTVAP
jgi:hypothetical protein